MGFQPGQSGNPYGRPKGVKNKKKEPQTNAAVAMLASTLEACQVERRRIQGELDVSKTRIVKLEKGLWAIYHGSDARERDGLVALFKELMRK